MNFTVIQLYCFKLVLSVQGKKIKQGEKRQERKRLNAEPICQVCPFYATVSCLIKGLYSFGPLWEHDCSQHSLWTVIHTSRFGMLHSWQPYLELYQCREEYKNIKQIFSSQVSCLKYSLIVHQTHGLRWELFHVDELHLILSHHLQKRIGSDCIKSNFLLDARFQIKSLANNNCLISLRTYPAT